VLCQLPLLFIGSVSTSFQLTGLRSVLDSRKNPATEEGQESVNPMPVRVTARLGLAEHDVFNQTVARA
jgi:hypothetical protein